MPITLPKTTVLGSSGLLDGKATVLIQRHSRCTGLSATLGGFTSRDGVGVSPATWNSSLSRGRLAEDAFIFSRSG